MAASKKGQGPASASKTAVPAPSPAMGQKARWWARYTMATADGERLHLDFLAIQELFDSIYHRPGGVTPEEALRFELARNLLQDTKAIEENQIYLARKYLRETIDSLADEEVTAGDAAVALVQQLTRIDPKFSQASPEGVATLLERYDPNPSTAKTKGRMSMQSILAELCRLTGALGAIPVQKGEHGDPKVSRERIRETLASRGKREAMKRRR